MVDGAGFSSTIPPLTIAGTLLSIRRAVSGGVAPLKLIVGLNRIRVAAVRVLAASSEAGPIFSQESPSQYCQLPFAFDPLAVIAIPASVSPVEPVGLLDAWNWTSSASENWPPNSVATVGAFKLVKGVSSRMVGESSVPSPPTLGASLTS